MDQDQAAEELRAIRSVMAQTRRMIDHVGGGWIFFLWGCIWLVGFSAAQFLSPAVSGWLWAGIDTLGIIGSIAIATRTRQKLDDPLGRRFGLFWLAIVGYVTLLWLLLGLDVRQGILVLLLTFALAYILFGLVTSPVIALAGLAIAAFAAGAYLLLSAFFYLIVGLLDGGTLIVLGLWMVRSQGK